VSVETTLEPRDSLARGAATITIASAVSRVTGFARVAVVAAALGGTFLVNTYQSANTAPNVVFELVAAGVLTSIFVPTFVEYLVRRERTEGWTAASVLTSVALVALIALALLIALAAPLIMRLLTLGVDDGLRQREIELGTTFLRLFSPQIVFYGVGMIMTGALHAHRKFAMAAIAPIFNNVFVIGVYLTYAAMRGDRPATVSGITTAETLVLGIGTTLGVVAMTVCLVPQLVKLGWRFRWRFDLSHPAVRKAARVGAWALGYAGGYQAGLIVVLILANGLAGGVAAYQWAYVFFFVPHALIAAPIFHVLFPAMSEDVARGETESLGARLRTAMTMLVFILAPVAAGLAVAAEPIARLTLEYGRMTAADATLVARVIGAFAIGLPTYSAFLVLTRAYYALGDPKTPALVNGLAVLVSSGTAAVLFFVVERRWAVPALALGHSIGFAVGTVVLVWLLKGRGVSLATRDVLGPSLRSIALALVAGAAMCGAGRLVDDSTKLMALTSLAVMAAVGAVVFLGGAMLTRAPEMHRLRELLPFGKRK
jgi:putative peptidoglycan lipid II flippase